MTMLWPVSWETVAIMSAHDSIASENEGLLGF